ncbi:MAG: hypothetical protein ACYTGZ_05815 [Planctomycetota bacterium]|jgi:hypothetical protein
MARIATLLLTLLFLGACSGGGGSGDEDGGAELPLLASSVEFGSIEMGQPATRSMDVRNPVGGLPVTITGLALSSPDLQVDPAGPAFPVRIQPGGRLTVPLIWTPAGDGFFSETVRVEANGRTPLVVAVSGTGIQSERLVDLGFVSFPSSGFVTPELFVDVPADAIGFTIEAYGGTTSAPTGGAVFLDRLTGPGGRVYVDEATPFSSPYIFERIWPTTQLFTVPGSPWVPRDHATFMVPNTDTPGVQLVPGGGTYSFVLSNNSGSLDGVNVRVIIETRPGGVTNGGHVDLNVFIANGLQATAATAKTSGHLQTILARAHNLLLPAGIGFGDVDYFDLVSPTFDFGDPFNSGPLFRNSAIASNERLNIFLVKTSSGGLFGLSGAIPGPRVQGSPIAGIFVIGDEIWNPNDLGSVLAHEVCHYLGLGHTKEAPGGGFPPWSFDIIDDTCPGTVCVGDLSLYLMDANANTQTMTLLTPGQAHVIRRHILVEPGPATFTPGAVFGTSALITTARLANTTCANCSR